MTYRTDNVQQTIDLGQAFASELQAGDIVLLDGEMGAGKTHFVKGIALGLRVEEMITSPTFAIMNVYKNGTVPLYHLDMYRAAAAEDLVELGVEEYVFDNHGIACIEWNKYTDFKNKRVFKVKISVVDDDIRDIVIKTKKVKWK